MSRITPKAELSDIKDTLKTASLDPQALSDVEMVVRSLVAERENLRNQIKLFSAREEQQRLDLYDAHSRPLRVLRRYLISKLLYALSRCAPPLPKRTAQRFARSANKRSAHRFLTQNTSDSIGQAYDAWLKGPYNALPHSDETRTYLRYAVQRDIKFSVVMPVYDPDPDLLRDCILSILGQSYDNFELCIADDASSDPRVKDVIEQIATQDPRIRPVYRTENGHISAASNSALELATGDFVVLVDHDDLIAQDALLEMAVALTDHPDAQLIYSDEDKITVQGDRHSPHFKPDWNRALFYSVNYISHLSAIDRKLIQSVGGFRPGFEGAQDYDLFLRCINQMTDEQIIHIPKVLYHWRTSESSTATDPSVKSYASECGVRALQDHLGDQVISVAPGVLPTTYVVTWPVPQPAPKVSLIIPTKDMLSVTQTAVDSIMEKTDYPNYEIVIVNNNSADPSTLAWFDQMQADHDNLRVIDYNEPFNYSAINNFAVAQTDGTIIGLINNDVEVINSNWLTEMVSLAVQDKNGCIGAKLYYPDGSIQHGGIIVGLGGVAGHSHKYFSHKDSGYFGRLKMRQEMSAVTAACLLVRREIFEDVGGLDAENLKVAFNDVDFCLKVQQAGYSNIWTPFAELYHHESISRGAEDSPEKIKRYQSETRFMKSKWNERLTQDPHYNPNLSQYHEDFSLRTW